MKISIFVNKNEEVLLDILNKSIENLQDNELNKVMDKWSVVKFTQKIDYELTIKITLVLLSLILLVFAWNYKLKEQKNQIKLLNEQLKIKIDELEVLSITDGMTKLYNRRYFDKVFSDELNRAKRKKHNFIFTMFDVDHFKQYNDTYGHDNGDKVLIQIAKVMQNFTHRANEFAFRIGGEEFCIITSEIDEETALKYIYKLMVAIEDSKIKHSGNSASEYVTASFGLIIIDFEQEHKLSTQEIYKMADNALYEAKESGRNNVVKVCV